MKRVVLDGKGGAVLATVKKSAKICAIFLSCDFPLQLGICVMASLIKKTALKGELKENPKTLPPKVGSLHTDSNN